MTSTGPPRNFQLAKIFMGDPGSMLIGLMLAASSTTASGRVPYPSPDDTLPLLLPLLVVIATPTGALYC